MIFLLSCQIFFLYIGTWYIWVLFIICYILWNLVWPFNMYVQGLICLCKTILIISLNTYNIDWYLCWPSLVPALNILNFLRNVFFIFISFCLLFSILSCMFLQWLHFCDSFVFLLCLCWVLAAHVLASTDSCIFLNVISLISCCLAMIAFYF